mmetsp:Transcript_29353/g.61213  ORF Transcript_29353/g.61213 Transcript_29353/m.61213 type:complete len:200 (+) Transcript_29353:1115-1714(+)
MGPRGDRPGRRHASRPRHADTPLRRPVGGRAPGARIGRAGEKEQGGRKRRCRRDHCRRRGEQEARERGGRRVSQGVQRVLVRSRPRRVDGRGHGDHGCQRIRIPVPGGKCQGGEGRPHRSLGCRVGQEHHSQDHRALARGPARCEGGCHAGGSVHVARGVGSIGDIGEEAGRCQQAVRRGIQEQESREEGGCKGGGAQG